MTDKISFAKQADKATFKIGKWVWCYDGEKYFRGTVLAISSDLDRYFVRTPLGDEWLPERELEIYKGGK